MDKITRTGIYVLSENRTGKCADRTWQVKCGTEFEVTAVDEEKGVFFSDALGGWYPWDVKAELIMPYNTHIKCYVQGNEGEDHYIPLESVSVSAGRVTGEAVKRLEHYEKFFTLEPYELYMLLQRLKKQNDDFKERFKQFAAMRRYGYIVNPTREEMEKLRSEISEGTRVELVEVNDPSAYIPAGTRGTVMNVDSLGNVDVLWDSGTRLKMIYGVDRYKKVGEVPVDKSSPSGIKVRLRSGWLVATAATDSDYPGIDIDYIDDTEDPEALSRPRALFEEPKDGELRLLIWEDSKDEDYTREITFKPE